jgi:hypothetical protein
MFGRRAGGALALAGTPDRREARVFGVKACALKSGRWPENCALPPGGGACVPRTARARCRRRCRPPTRRAPRPGPPRPAPGPAPAWLAPLLRAAVAGGSPIACAAARAGEGVPRPKAGAAGGGPGGFQVRGAEYQDAARSRRAIGGGFVVRDVHTRAGARRGRPQGDGHEAAAAAAAARPLRAVQAARAALPSRAAAARRRRVALPLLVCRHDLDTPARDRPRLVAAGGGELAVVGHEDDAALKLPDRRRERAKRVPGGAVDGCNG